MPVEQLQPAGKAAPATDFQRQMLHVIPELRRYARRLASDPHDADDLVQETSIRAMKNQSQFQPATNMRAWLFTICRNLHCSLWQKQKRMVELLPSQVEALQVSGGQEATVDLSRVLSIIAALPPTQCKAVALVMLGGCTYEEAASLEHCAVGTMKSRVSRAKEAMAGLSHGRSAQTASQEGRDADTVFAMFSGVLTAGLPVGTLRAGSLL